LPETVGASFSGFLAMIFPKFAEPLPASLKLSRAHSGRGPFHQYRIAVGPLQSIHL